MGQSNIHSIKDEVNNKFEQQVNGVVCKFID
jgi:hypothetical protein